MKQTQFKPGQSGNPAGKPKGAVSKVKIKQGREMKASVNARACDMLEGILGKAMDVIDEGLDNGDRQIAMWLMDRMLKSGNSLLPEAVDVVLNSIDNVILAAQQVSEMVMHRKLSIDDGTKMLNMLSQYASFRAFERIDELRLLVDEMKAASELRTIPGTATHLPSWGRLSEATPVANKVPGE